MPIWLIFASLGAIGVTALLMALLYRINAPLLERRDGTSPAGDGDGD